jgi:hypothetical protein
MLMVATGSLGAARIDADDPHRRRGRRARLARLRASLHLRVDKANEERIAVLRGHSTKLRVD